MHHDPHATDHRRHLADLDILAGLPPERTEEIAAAAPARSFTAGELICTPRQRAESLFLLTHGRVRTFTLATDGRTLTTALLEPGALFGEILPSPEHHPADQFAEAVDDVTVCVMNRADVQRLLLTDPRVSSRMCAILARRVRELERRLSDAVFKTGPQRVAASLILLADHHTTAEAHRPVQLTVTHDELAALAGTTRETVTRVLGSYAGRGLIRLRRGTTTILDPAALAVEADQHTTR